jgi:hypothetical protein
MQNPCDLCIVKVNCTQVCSAKENSMALLRTAIAQRTQNGKGHPHHFREWREYSGLYNQGLTDIIDIYERAREAKGISQSSF